MMYQPSFLIRCSFRLYQIFMIALTPLFWGFLGVRCFRRKEILGRLGERFGWSALNRPSGPLIWVHAASVGESLSTLPLIRKLLKQNPALHVMVTTNTRTSAELMEKRLPQRAFHQFFPFDQAFCIKRFLKKWNPQGVLWLESELWPGFLREIHRREIPLVLVNARLSSRSFQRWQRYSHVIQFLLSQFSLCLAQSVDMAFRLRKLGASTVRMPGNLKFSSPPLSFNPNDFAHLKALIGSRPLWCAASTHEGEERLIGEIHKKLKMFFPSLLTIIVPRHPSRGQDICLDLEAQGVRTALRSEKRKITEKIDIYVADTIGELGLFYRLAPLVFIGGSFVPVGGHNPIEPALLGCALLWGPYIENFQEVAHKFLEQGAAIQVSDEKDLFEKTLMLIQESESLLTLEEKARRLAKSEQDVLERIVDDIIPFFPFLHQTLTPASTFLEQ